MTEKSAREWIKILGLEKHPEGGYYRRTYEAAESIPAGGLSDRFGGGERLISSAIHYLVEAGSPSRLHRIRSDELWHFYAGGPLRIHVLDAGGDHREILLGPDPDRGQHFQAAVPHGAWFAAEVAEGAYSLCGCTVAPGFAFEDLELADRKSLLAAWPHHRELIERLT